MQNVYHANDGTLLGTAEVPEGYSAEGELYHTWQSELQPFSAVMQSRSPNGTIAMCVTNKDIRYDLRNPLLRGIGLLVANHTEKGYDKVMPEEEYIQNWAEARTGLSLQLRDVTVLGNYDASALIQYEKNQYDAFLEIPSEILNAASGWKLYRFACEISGVPGVVLAGMEWFSADLRYRIAGMQMPEGVAKAVEAAKERLGIDTASLKDTISNARETMKGMTFSDYMHGGLIGKMRREKKNRTEQPKREEVPKENRPAAKGDLTIFGASRRYLCLCAAEKEKEAEEIFLTFIRTAGFDPSLYRLEASAVADKMAAIRHQAAMNQQMAMQKQAELQAMQAKTSQMLAQNARQMSDGLMDSWQKKMDSDSRISQGFSEAIRGVDTYQTSSGQDVEVGLSADHVYENQYGDVYGVSGNAPDQQTLNELNWNEIYKKPE